MTTFARKSDGRRIYTDAFKRKQAARLWRGERTPTQLSRELGIARSLLQRWKRMVTATGARVASSPLRAGAASRLDTAQYIRELQLLVGKQSMELEMLRAELDELKRARRPISAS